MQSISDPNWCHLISHSDKLSISLDFLEDILGFRRHEATTASLQLLLHLRHRCPTRFMCGVPKYLDASSASELHYRITGGFSFSYPLLLRLSSLTLRLSAAMNAATNWAISCREIVTPTNFSGR